MRSPASRRALLGLVALALVAATCPRDDRPPATRIGGELPPNVILVVTDDQTAASMHGEPVSMPWLKERLAEPGWTTFTNAVVTTPLCCPSRASILTGRYARRTGVSTNHDGANLDPGDTIAAALHDAGYRTALIGKYLNGYPWEGAPIVPPGWDRWFAKLNASDATLYYGYDVVDDGDRRTIGHEEGEYATDLLAAEAVAFVTETPADRPFFLHLSPSAPHGPAEPAPRHASLLEGEPPLVSADALATMNDVEGGPWWIRSAPPIDPTVAEALAIAELRERATLRAVDDAMRALWDAVAARGELDRTVWLFLSDNGFSFGDRRWVGKTCPWETCVHVPFVVHVPGSDGGISEMLVANIDVAPTIAELANVDAGDVDGWSVLPLLEGGAPRRDRRAVLLEWAGSAQVPPWVGVRLADAVLIQHDDGTRELYDLVTDPDQRRNLIGEGAGSALQARAERALERALEGSASDG